MDFERYMSDADGLMWAIEKDPVLRSTITMVSVLDRAPDRRRLLERLEYGTRAIPRMRQRAVRAPLVGAPPRWVTDADVDLGYHVRCVKAPGAGTERDLLDLAAPIAMQSFDRARPLWEFHVVEGLADGRAALIQKVHHSITDGVGGMKLALLLLDLERDPSETPSAESVGTPAADRLSTFGLVVEAIDHERRRQLGNARRAASVVTAAVRRPLGAALAGAEIGASVARMLAPAFEPLSPLMKDRSLAVHFSTLTVPLAEMKAAAKRADGKLNDAFVAAVAGGLRRYHAAHGLRAEELRTTMPINVRSDATEGLAGNQFVPARFNVPVGIDDPVERMRAVRALVAAQRGEPALGFTEPIAGLLNRLPTSVVTQLFGSMLKGVDFITSNVPGAPFPVFLAGARVEANFAFGPLTGAATNVVLLSYQDDLHIGVNTDRAAIPDPQVFADCLEAGFDEVRKLA